MGCVWYNPTCKAEDFDDSVLNEYEKLILRYWHQWIPIKSERSNL